MASWLQKYGAFILAICMAVLTAGYHHGITRNEIAAINVRQDKTEKRLDDFSANGSPFAQSLAREFRQSSENDREKIAEIKKSTDKALEILATQREATVRMEQQIAYLVKICAEKAHANISKPRDTPIVAIAP